MDDFPRNPGIPEFPLLHRHDPRICCFHKIKDKEAGPSSTIQGTVADIRGDNALCASNPTACARHVPGFCKDIISERNGNFGGSVIIPFGDSCER